jgi:hypothetical protein
MEHIKLNENEMAVLKGAKISSDGNNGDFGFAERIKIEGLNRHQIAGYIGALVAKDLLRVYDQGTSRECFELQLKAEELCKAWGIGTDYTGEKARR